MVESRPNSNYVKLNPVIIYQFLDILHPFNLESFVINHNGGKIIPGNGSVSSSSSFLS